MKGFVELSYWLDIQHQKSLAWYLEFLSARNCFEFAFLSIVSTQKLFTYEIHLQSFRLLVSL